MNVHRLNVCVPCVAHADRYERVTTIAAVPKRERASLLSGMEQLKRRFPEGTSFTGSRAYLMRGQRKSLFVFELHAVVAGAAS